MISGSARLFIFMTIRPSDACASARISSSSRGRSVAGRDEDPPVAVAVGVAGEAVEEVGDVRGQLRVGRKQPDVLVRRSPSPGCSCRCRRGSSGGSCRPRGARRARSSHGSSGRRRRRRRGRRPSRAFAPRRCSPPRRRAPSARRGDDLLAGLGGADQRAHDRRLAFVRRPVDRLLDREHVRIVGGLVDERLDRSSRSGRRGGARARRASRASRRCPRGGRRALPELGRRDAEPGLRLQGGPLQLGERPEIAQVEQPVDLVEVGAASSGARAGAVARISLRHRARRPRAERPRASAAGRAAAIRASSSRSSASSTSTSMSASRVTRNGWCATIFIPGKRRSRCAAITCSSGTNRRPPATLRKRGRSGGTFTRAKRRTPLAGSRTTTARLSERSEMYGKRVGRIDRERGEHREDALLEHLLELASRCAFFRSSQSVIWTPPARELRRHLRVEHCVWRRDELLRALPDRVELLRGLMPVGRRARHAGDRTARAGPRRESGRTRRGCG